MLVVVFRSLRCCLSFGLRRPLFVVLVFLRFHLCLLFAVLLCRLIPRLSRGPLCHRRYYPLHQVRVRVSTSSLRVRVSTSRLVVRVAVVLFVTALTVAGMATLGPHVIHGILVYVSSTRLVVSRLLQDLQQLPLSDQDIIWSLRGLLAATGSSSMGTTGSMTDSPGTARPPPSTQSGTSP